MSKFEEIDEARRILGLSEAATLKEIKSAYRALAHYHHPDKHKTAAEGNEDKMKQLNRAYKILMDYCTDYKYALSEEAVARTYPYDEDIKKWRDKWSV